MHISGKRLRGWWGVMVVLVCASPGLHAGEIYVSTAAQLQTALQTAPAGATIVLQNDITLSNTITFPNARIYDVDGGGYTISGAGFYLYAFGSPFGSLTNITIEGARSGDGAPAWFVGSTRPDANGNALSNSTFRNNTTNSYAGAFGVATGILNGNVTNNVFENNRANGAAYGGAFGIGVNEMQGSFIGNTFTGNAAGSYAGAINLRAGFDAGITTNSIVASAGTAAFDGNTFENNTAGSYGGAIVAWGNIVGDLTNNRFINNTASGTAGAGYGGALVILNNRTLTGNITGGEFTGNTARTDGGAIYMGGTITGGISGTAFTSNTATTGLGGAIYLGGNLTDGITGGAVFRTNRSAGNGGAIFISGALTGGIADSTFDGNITNAGSGGGLYMGGTFAGGITDSVFTGNQAASAGARGGAVFLNSAFSGDFSGNRMSQNAADSHGGAVYFNTGGLANGISGGEYSENSSTTGHGGAIYITGTLGNGISGANFTGNTANAAGRSGGAVYVAGDLTGGLSGVVMDDNTASASGGALYVTGNIAGGITGSNFTGNSTATGVGGAMHLGGTFSGDITNSTFATNTALATGASGGAMHFANAYSGTISGTSLTGNRAALHGGGMYFATGGLQNGLDGGTMSGNTAVAGSGGAIYVTGDLANGVTDTVFTGNSATAAGQAGGALAVTGGWTGGITGATFQNNRGDANGGAITVGGAFDGGISSATFTGNASASGSGGALYVAGTFGGDLDTVTMTGNTAGANGGGIYFAQAFTGNLTGGRFENNEAGSGGALYLNTGGLTQGITGGSYSGNTARTGSGGAIYLAGDLENGVSNAAFDNNTASDQGGALLIGGDFSGGLDGASFSENSAGLTGGAVMVAGSFTGGMNNATSFRDNSADMGGGIYVAGDFSGDVADTTFTGNTATSAGGGLYAATGIDGGLTGNTVTGNTAGSSGGGLFIGGALIGDIDGGLYSGNAATTGDGGAVYAAGTIAGITDGHFDNNTALGVNGRGGALALLGGATGGIAGRFDGNRAGSHGGAIYSLGAIAGGMTGVTMTNNASTGGDGGAVWAAGGLAVTGSTFTGNSAVHGGAIASSGGDLSITDTNFTNNTAASAGGAIFNNGGALTMTATTGTMTLRGNTANGAFSSVALAGTGSFTIDTAAGATMAMYDPFSGTVDGPYAITKNGGGTWLLAGTSRVDGSVIMNITEGTLQLAGDADGGNGSIALSNNASVAVQSGAVILADGDNSISAGVITLADGAVIRQGLGDDEGDASLTLSTAPGSKVSLGGAVEVAVASNGFTLNGGFTGSGGFTKTGNGRLVLTGDSDYTGATSVAAGTLAVTNGNATGAAGGSVAVDAGATLELAFAANGSYNKAISGGGQVKKTGDATVTLQSQSTHTGRTSVEGGVLSLAAANALASSSEVDVMTGSLTATADQSFQNLQSRVGTTVAMGGNDLTVDAGHVRGTLSGVHDLNKVTGGAFLLDGSTTLTGALNVQAGSLGVHVGDAPAITAQSVSFAPGSVLDIAGVSSSETTGVVVIRSATGIAEVPSYTIGGQTGGVDYLTVGLQLSSDSLELLVTTGLTWYNLNTNPVTGNYSDAAGTFTLNGTDSVFTVNTVLADRTGNFETGWDGQSLTKNGTGRLILQEKNTYSGDTTVNGGNLTLRNVDASGRNRAEAGAVNLADATATLQFDQSAAAAAAGEQYNKTITGSGNVLKTGVGRVVLAGDNSYTGTTTVSEGTLALANQNAAGQNDASRTVTVDEPGRLELAFNGEFNQAVTGAGTVAKTGTGTVVLTNGNNDYTGTTTIESGTLEIRDVGATGENDASRNVVNRGILNLNIDADATYAKTITGTGDVVKSGSGRLVLSGSNTYSGDTVVAGGTLALTSVYAGGRNFPAFTTRVDAGGTLELATGGAFFRNITGAGNFLKTGADELILVGGNAYTGRTTIAGGTLTLTSVDSTGSNTAGTVVDNSGTLKLDIDDPTGSGTAVYNKSITGTGEVVKANGGRVTLAGNSNYTGDTVIDGGILALANVDAAGSNTAGTNVLVNRNGALELATGGTFNKTITGEGMVAKSGADRVEVTSAANGFTGNILVTGGTLAFTSVGAAGDNAANRLVQVNAGAALEMAMAADGTLNKTIIGAGDFVKTGDGNLTLASPSNYGGLTHVREGTLTLASVNSAGRNAGGTQVLVDAGAALNLAGDGTFNKQITGGGAVEKSGTGTTVLANANTYTGGTTVSAGTLETTNAAALGTGAVNVAGGANLDLRYNGTFANTLAASTGTVNTYGDIVFTGDQSAFQGDVHVQGERLTLGAAGETGFVSGGNYIVHRGGVLAGNGTIGRGAGYDGLYVRCGGTVSPGNSIGTINVNGNLVMENGAFYQVEVDFNDTNNADLLAVTGSATLNGATVVYLGGIGGEAVEGARWLILSSTDRVDEFSHLVQVRSRYITPELIHEGDNVYLSLRRNDISFDEDGLTPNQSSVASGLDTLNPNSDLHLEVTALADDHDRAGIYDLLSGEAHSSLMQSLSSYNQAVTLSLRRRASDLFAACRTAAGDDSAAWVPACGPQLWAQAEYYRASADASDPTNSAKAKFTSKGVTIGGESWIGNRAFLGASFRYGDGEQKVDGRRSKADIDSYNFTLYGGWDAFRTANAGLTVTAGLGYAFHRIDSRRTIAGTPISDQTLRSKYTNHGLQAFGEAAYTMLLSPQWRVTPYAALALDSMRARGFGETGGSAALDAPAKTRTSAYSTLGSRFSYSPFAAFTVTADIGWQHLLGGDSSARTYRFAAGSGSFRIDGAKLPRDAAVAAVSLQYDIRPNLRAYADYEGVYGSGHRSNGFNLGVQMSF